LAGKTPIKDFVDLQTIKDRDRVAGTFLVQTKQIPLNRNGKPYIAMQLMNRTGTVAARVWDNVDQFASVFESGDFLQVRGIGVEYQNKVQLKVDWLERVDSATVNPEDFLPASPRDRQEMLGTLQALVDTIGDAPLRDLIRGCLADDTFRERFVRSPAAKTIHHAYLGGLLEHTLTVMELADRVAAVYPGLSRDLLLAGAFFHDIGKTRELGHERSFEYSDEGRLIGHIVMGANMFSDWAEQHPDLPEETVLKLTHMILSHHGTYEFGSPKRPKFAEALVLNYIDEMDSKVQTLKEISGRETGQKWSSFQKLFDRYLYLGESESTAAGDAQETQVLPKSPARRQGRDLTHRPFDQLAEATDKPPAPGNNDSQSLDLFAEAKTTKRKR